MGKRAKVTENKFRAIKILLESGETYSKISEAMGVSPCVIGLIRSSDSLEEYRHKVYLKTPAYRKKIEEQERKEKEKADFVSAKQMNQVMDAIAATPAELPSAPQVVEHRQTITVQASHFMLEEQKRTNELLTLISNKLAFIVDELTK